MDILGNIKHYLSSIFGNRGIQITILLFVVGLLLIFIGNITTTEETVESETLGTQEDSEIRDLYYPGRESYLRDTADRIYDDIYTEDGLPGVQSAVLVVQGEDEETNATIEVFRGKEEKESIEKETIQGTRSIELDLTGKSPSHMEFTITSGNITYTYTLEEIVLPYRYLSIPAFICMIAALPTFFWGLSSLNFRKIDDEEKKKLERDQEVVENILKKRKK